MGSYPKVVAVVGTNASGKSALGIELAKRYGGEVISADSRQVFKGLDLGSGKVTAEEMQGVVHHLIDVREPNEFFSMADFQKMSYAAIEDIRARGRLPMIVGGTGLYVDSVLDGYVLSDKEPDLAYRAELEKLTTPELYDMLMELIADMAALCDALLAGEVRGAEVQELFAPGQRSFRAYQGRAGVVFAESQLA